MEIEEGLRLILARAGRLGTVSRPLADCGGLVLAETVRAPMAVPPFPKSAMDGYAVLAAETAGASRERPARLKVAGRLLAGDYEEIAHRPGTAVRIMTGAFIPPGHDAVVPQEDTDRGEGEVAVYAPVKPGQNYCRAGEDIPLGAEVARQGQKLGPVHLGLLAGVGLAEVPVCRPPQVAILGTGSELATPGEKLAPGQIYNSITYILAAAVEREGLVVAFRGHCADDEALLAAKLGEALGAADVVITTGGVSVGQKDVVPAALQRLGAEILFRRANIQPGTHTTASAKGGKVILSLAGNPYAAIVNFEVYFWPLVAALTRCEALAPRRAEATLQSDYRKVNPLRRFLRARAEGGLVTLPAPQHQASIIHNLTMCNCFIDLPAGRAVKPGDTVTIQYIKGM